MAARWGLLVQMSWTLIALVSATSAELYSYEALTEDDYNLDQLWPEPVENLSVVAVEHDGDQRSLQLYVNWSAPSEGPLPEGYFLSVKSINESSDYCQSIGIAEELNSTVTWFLAPPEVSVVEHDPRIEHECTYNVLVESRPFDGRRAAQLNYTVPERVGSLWSCRTSSSLPEPLNLSVSVVDDTAVDVAWQVDAADAETVDAFSLRLGTKIESPIRDWFDFGPEVLVDAASWTGGALRMQHRLRGLRVQPLPYLLQVRVVDQRGCRGPPAEARFHGTGLGSTSASLTGLLVAVPVVLLAAAAAVVVALLCRRRGCWRAASSGRQAPPTQPWLDGYSTIAVQSSNGISSLTDVTSHRESEMQQGSYASDIELVGIKARCGDV